MADADLAGAYERCPGRSAKLEIRREMVRRGLAAPELLRMWKEKDEEALGRAYDGIDIYASDLEACENRIAIAAEMKSRGLAVENMALEEYWRNASNAKLISEYRQLHLFDRISQEIIYAEVKKRQLETKAATKNERRARSADVAELGGVPFGLMLALAWKWVWAIAIALVPLAALWMALKALKAAASGM
jgi:hypothetical protein